MLKLDEWSGGIPEGPEVVGDGTRREHPGPEVRERPRRRRFSLEYKLRVSGEAGAGRSREKLGRCCYARGFRGERGGGQRGGGPRLLHDHSKPHDASPWLLRCRSQRVCT